MCPSSPAASREARASAMGSASSGCFAAAFSADRISLSCPRDFAKAMDANAQLCTMIEFGFVGGGSENEANIIGFSAAFNHTRRLTPVGAEA